MTHVDPHAASEPARKRGDGEDRRQSSPSHAERPPEPHSFEKGGAFEKGRAFEKEQALEKEPAFESEPVLDIMAPNPLTVGASFAVEHELVQLTQEMIRVSHQAFNEAMTVWRRSLEPVAASRLGMNRWYEDFIRQATGFGAVRPLRAARPSASAAMAAWMGGPPLDLKEAPDAYRLEVEVPGMEADSLELSVKDGLLIVSGRKAEAIDGGAYQISERRYGRFERAVPLPDRADLARIEATLSNGVLTVTLPKDAEAVTPPNRIRIRTAGDGGAAV